MDRQTELMLKYGPKDTCWAATWGAMDAGDYEAPTILSINAIGVHSRYR